MATRLDVCNGDADGLCAAVQWRLHRPGAVRLVTGLKRDISLLQGVPARAGDEVNVFDISMPRNRGGLLRLLDEGAHARYFDHHAAPGDPLRGAGRAGARIPGLDVEGSRMSSSGG